jgi:hypothetical protein
MSVAFNFDPTVISSSRLLSLTHIQAILSMCIKLQLRDGDTVNSELDQKVTLGISLETNVGIIELIENDPNAYGIQLCECDPEVSTEYSRLQANETAKRQALVQGNTVTICVVPDDYSIEYGVVLRSINAFLLQ